MKVLLVSVKSEKSKGGIATWTNQYLSGCEAAGIECDIVNTEAVGKIAVHATGKRNLKDEFIRTRRINSQLNYQLKQNYYDLAHLNTSIGFLGIIRDYYVARNIVRYKIPLVVHFHCDIPYWVRNPLKKFYLKRLLKLSKVNFVLCQNSHYYLKSQFNQDSVFIPNFVNKKFIIDNKKISSEIKTICFIGRVSGIKGAREIFEVAQKFPNIQFKLVGEVSSDVQSWTKPVNVELLGILSHDKAMEILDDSDLFFFPSHTEGFSLALAESMARGVPIIATDVGANFNMIESHGGRIVDVGDITAMTDAVDKMQDPSLRQKMSNWCINKVNNNYTVNQVMGTIKQLYENVLEEK